jgi:hypothetical protein
MRVKITDEKGIANSLAGHFRNVGNYLVDQITDGRHNDKKCLPNKVDKTIFI